MSRITFHSSATGVVRENDDDYTLITDENGKQTVEHAWSHVNVRGGGEIDKGATEVTVEEFLNGQASAEIKAKLRAALGEA